jgi:hypothetical protein
VLYDFGEETFAELVIENSVDTAGLSVYFGESAEEATDTAESYLFEKLDGKMSYRLNACAFRFVYIPEKLAASLKLSAYYQYLPLEDIGSFECDDKLINDVWKTCAYTFHLCSREFFLDGIKVVGVALEQIGDTGHILCVDFVQAQLALVVETVHTLCEGIVAVLVHLGHLVEQQVAFFVVLLIRLHFELELGMRVEDAVDDERLQVFLVGEYDEVVFVCDTNLGNILDVLGVSTNHDVDGHQGGGIGLYTQILVSVTQQDNVACHFILCLIDQGFIK